MSMAWRIADRRWIDLPGTLALALIVALAGCATPPPPGPASPALPAGAVAVGPDLYQVPIGADAEGCPMYRLHSPSRMVTQAISWRRPDGSFTLDRSEAACAR
jgi:hypothetical protein